MNNLHARLAEGDARVERGAILVVDDDAALRSVVRQALELDGWRVLEAAEGAAALTVCEREGGRLGLVVLDLNMPVLNGPQFAARYWATDGISVRRAPLVVFTADSGLAAAEQAERLRAVGFVTKPFELDELLAVVARCARPVAEREGGASDWEVVRGLPSGEQAMVRGDEAEQRTEAEQKAIVSRVEAKPSPGEVARQRQMERLRAQLAQVQDDMRRVRLGVTEVSRIELSRRLTREEARRASQLRMESERLRWELQLIRDEFFRLREERRS